MKQSRITGIALAAANGILIFICAILYLGKDRQGPELTFEAVDTIYREGAGTEELLKGVSARDKEDGDISGRIVIEKISENREENTAVVFYAVSDKAGNVARASRVFTAVYAQPDEGNVSGRFLEAGIEAELKEGNITNIPEADGEAAGENGAGEENEIRKEEDGEKGGKNGAENDGEHTGIEADSREDVQERGTEADAASSPAGNPGPLGRTAPSSLPALSAEQEEVLRTEPKTEPHIEPETESHIEPAQEAANRADGQAPVLSLKVREVEVKAGQGPAWVGLIETLSDDKDGYETLFGNLNVSRYDRNKPGTYQVSVSTEDSDGNRSETVPLTITVK